MIIDIAAPAPNQISISTPGVQGIPGTGGGVAATPVDIQVFTSNGTWTKPAGVTRCEIYCVGAGGGGGSGMREYTAQERGGGGGGAGGNVSIAMFRASDLSATVPVIVGVGIGGAATYPGGQSTYGGVGGTSSLVGYLNASGGAGGVGGATMYANGGASPVNVGIYTGLGSPGGMGRSYDAPIKGENNIASLGAPGGGGGGGMNGAGVCNAGASGGWSEVLGILSGFAGGAINTKGEDAVTSRLIGYGGGGAGGSTTTGFPGGNGIHGGGGGGGGGGVNMPSGKGGDSVGLVVVASW